MAKAFQITFPTVGTIYVSVLAADMPLALRSLSMHDI